VLLLIAHVLLLIAHCSPLFAHEIVSLGMGRVSFFSILDAFRVRCLANGAERERERDMSRTGGVLQSPCCGCNRCGIYSVFGCV
jgi:hypothetical protein